MKNPMRSHQQSQDEGASGKSLSGGLPQNNLNQTSSQSINQQSQPNNFKSQQFNIMSKRQIKSKTRKNENNIRSNGAKQVTDPCISFGCTCTICKTHITGLRREGDPKAIKAYKDEIDFEKYAFKMQVAFEREQVASAYKQRVSQSVAFQDIAGNLSIGNLAQSINQEVSHIQPSLYHQQSGHSPESNKYSSKTNNNAIAGVAQSSSTPRDRLTNKKIIPKFEKKDFIWLIEKLLPPHEKVCGCQFWMPDTAFFEGGKLKFIVKTDKEDGCLILYKNKPNLKNLRMSFSELTRERKLEATDTLMTDAQLFLCKMDSDSKTHNNKAILQNVNELMKQGQGVTGKKVQFNNSGTLGKGLGAVFLAKVQQKIEEQLKEMNEIEKDQAKVTNRDFIVFKYTDDAVKVLSDQEFQNEFNRKRENDIFWNQISYIQSTVKAKIGLGKCFSFTFTSPCFKKDAPTSSLKDPHTQNQIRFSYEGELEFNYKQFGNDDVSLQTQNPIAYCFKVCHKIGYYLQQIHEEELIRMKCEFFQDDHGKIWLFNLSDIWVRYIEERGNIFVGKTPKSPLVATLQKIAKRQEEQDSLKKSDKKKKRSRSKNPEEGEAIEQQIEKAVDKELEDLVFRHKNQMGKKVNLDDIRREVNQIKQKASNYNLEQMGGFGQLSIPLHAQNKLNIRVHSHLKPTQQDSSIENHKLLGASTQDLRRHTYIMQFKDQNKKKLGDVMTNYYKKLKKDGDVDKELQMDSSCTDNSTAEAINQLRPLCPLKMKEIVQREINTLASENTIVPRGHPHYHLHQQQQEDLGNSMIGNFINRQSVSGYMKNKKNGKLNQQPSVQYIDRQALGFSSVEGGFRQSKNHQYFNSLKQQAQYLSSSIGYDFDALESQFEDPRQKVVHIREIMERVVHAKTTLDFNHTKSQQLTTKQQNSPGVDEELLQNSEFQNSLSQSQNQKSVTRNVNGVQTVINNNTGNIKSLHSAHSPAFFQTSLQQQQQQSNQSSQYLSKVLMNTQVRNWANTNISNQGSFTKNHQHPFNSNVLQSRQSVQISSSTPIDQQFLSPVARRKLYAPPVKTCDFPSQNPFFNGQISTPIKDLKQQLQNYPQPSSVNQQQRRSIPIASSASNRTPNFANMSKQQQVKIKQLLAQRAKYLQIASMRSQWNQKSDEELMQMSFEDIVKMREQMRDDENIEQKDHFFRNEHVIDDMSGKQNKNGLYRDVSEGSEQLMF